MTGGTHHFLSKSESDNAKIAKHILDICGEAKIFAFFGNLGAGKTTFIKSFCKLLGVDENVSSPTFTLIHEYQTAGEDVYHFDFYRLESEEEALAIGVEEYFYSENYCFLEWSERIPNLLPEDCVEIHIQINEDNSRALELIC